PIAGQGFNLSLRDAYALAEALLAGPQVPGDLASWRTSNGLTPERLIANITPSEAHNGEAFERFTDRRPDGLAAAGRQPLRTGLDSRRHGRPALGATG
ncbi:hypothetical protein ACQX1J_11935, partial [Corynebacterium diphtheriae]